MPIIEHPQRDQPLSQGDVLCEIPLYKSKVTPEGTSFEASSAPLCMIVSRPCNLAHKPEILVAEIAKYKTTVSSDVQSFDDMLDFLTSIRDGRDAPDRFYLGPIPDRAGRFVAKLDSIFTITAKSADLLLQRRIAALNVDFQRDLHLRVFNAVASLGFNDTEWFPTEDLEALLTLGEAELAKLRTTEADQRAAHAKQAFNDRQIPEKAIQELTGRVADLEEKIRPYAEQLSKRRSHDPSQ